MNRTEYLLTQAASECNEVAHRITKALHFSLKEVQPGQPKNNSERIVEEMIDLLAVFEMLEEEGIIAMPPNAETHVAVEAKKAKVEKFFEYARRECGTITTEPQPALTAR